MLIQNRKRPKSTAGAAAGILEGQERLKTSSIAKDFGWELTRVSIRPKFNLSACLAEGPSGLKAKSTLGRMGGKNDDKECFRSAPNDWNTDSNHSLLEKGYV